MTVREKRKKLDLRLVDIAGTTGMDTSVLSRIENNKQIPNGVQKRNIAEALGCDVSDIRFPRAILAYGG